MSLPRCPLISRSSIGVSSADKRGISGTSSNQRWKIQGAWGIWPWKWNCRAWIQNLRIFKSRSLCINGTIWQLRVLKTGHTEIWKWIWILKVMKEQHKALRRRTIQLVCHHIKSANNIIGSSLNMTTRRDTASSRPGPIHLCLNARISITLTNRDSRSTGIDSPKKKNKRNWKRPNYGERKKSCCCKMIYRKYLRFKFSKLSSLGPAMKTRRGLLVQTLQGKEWRQAETKYWYHIDLEPLILAFQNEHNPQLGHLKTKMQFTVKKLLLSIKLTNQIKIARKARMCKGNSRVRNFFLRKHLLASVKVNHFRVALVLSNPTKKLIIKSARRPMLGVVKHGGGRRSSNRRLKTWQRKLADWWSL